MLAEFCWAAFLCPREQVTWGQGVRLTDDKMIQMLLPSVCLRRLPPSLFSHDGMMALLLLLCVSVVLSYLVAAAFQRSSDMG